MKRKFLFLVLSGYILLSMSSCISLFFAGVESGIIRNTRIVEWSFDQSLPQERTAKVLMWSGELKAYNGIDIASAFTTAKMLHIKPLLNIPAGVSEFTFDYTYTRSYGNTTIYYNVKECIFKYNFEADKKYFVSIGREQTEKGGLIKDAQYVFNINIYDYWPVLDGDRISNNEYKKLEKELPSKKIAVIPIFRTEDVEKKK